MGSGTCLRLGLPKLVLTFKKTLEAEIDAHFCAFAGKLPGVVEPDSKKSSL
jgi:hypothetical protein